MMPVNQYAEGQRVRCLATFTDYGGALGDPATVTFKFRTPTGLVTSYTFGADLQLVRDSLGTYHVDVDAISDGRWHWRWQSTGAIAGAKEHYFDVTSSKFQ
jgi:hypothetical protein